MMVRFLFCAWLLLGSMAFGSDCKQPLAEDTLNKLSFGFSQDVQLKPGETYQFSLAVYSTYAPSEPVKACATWRVEPEGKGASINDGGLLRIDSTTLAGSRFVVTADIEKGRAHRSLPVIVYTDATHPLVGFWKQKHFECGNTGETPPPQVGTIEELEFRASGWFSATWLPFEVYRDYWGSYTIDPAQKTLSLKIERGNYVPKTFQGSGTYKFTAPDTLEMDGLFLGLKNGMSAAPEPKIPTGCFYIFTRSH